jgi:hypothetical protein
MGAPETDDCSQGDWQRIDAPTLILLDEAVLPPDSHLPLLNIVA